MARNMSSPVWWPWTSLNSLKRSIPSISAAVGMLAAAAPDEHLIGAVDDERPVGQAGEHVVQRHVVQLAGVFGRFVEGAAPGHDERAQHEEEDQGARAMDPPTTRPRVLPVAVPATSDCRTVTNPAPAALVGKVSTRPPAVLDGVEEPTPALSGVDPRQGHVEIVVEARRRRSGSCSCRRSPPPNPAGRRRGRRPWTVSGRRRAAPGSRWWS